MAHHGWRIGSLVLAASLALAGCNSDGETASASTPPPVSGGKPSNDSPAPPANDSGTPSAGNAAPQVSGTPVSAVSLGQAWTFQPSATDPDGDALTWSISGKPSDATFSPATGLLSWTPGSSGTWNNIVITVTDSRGASASLPAFSVAVTGSQAQGTALLSWEMPRQYSDGGALLPEDEIAGYRVYHGNSQDQLDKVIPVTDAKTLQYTLSGLTAGTHYFAVSAIAVNGAEGERSEVLTKTVM